MHYREKHTQGKLLLFEIIPAKPWIRNLQLLVQKLNNGLIAIIVHVSSVLFVRLLALYTCLQSYRNGLIITSDWLRICFSLSLVQDEVSWYGIEPIWRKVYLSSLKTGNTLNLSWILQIRFSNRSCIKSQFLRFLLELVNGYSKFYWIYSN